jgi:hypothetical protein
MPVTKANCSRSVEVRRTGRGGPPEGSRPGRGVAGVPPLVPRCADGEEEKHRTDSGR